MIVKYFLQSSVFLNFFKMLIIKKNILIINNAYMLVIYVLIENFLVVMF